MDLKGSRLITRDKIKIVKSFYPEKQTLDKEVSHIEKKLTRFKKFMSLNL